MSMEGGMLRVGDKGRGGGAERRRRTSASDLVRGCNASHRTWGNTLTPPVDSAWFCSR